MTTRWLQPLHTRPASRRFDPAPDHQIQQQRPHRPDPTTLAWIAAALTQVGEILAHLAS